MLHSEAKAQGAETAANVAIECGWGRLIIGETFDDLEELAETIRNEAEGRRDIALYVDDPHILLSKAPQELFLDPSNTYRLELIRAADGPASGKGYVVESLAGEADADGVRAVMQRAHLVAPSIDFLITERDQDAVIVLVAKDRDSGKVLGSVTGVDHVAAYGCPKNSCSLWGLAVDPQAPYPGIGGSLVCALAKLFAKRGRTFLDLSVMHDNESAIALYEKMGFERVPVFCIKRKNPINEPLFVGRKPAAELNPYSRIIVDEALRRGIHVEILDASDGFFRLKHGGRSIVCRESLSELTSAVAMSRCDNKATTLRLLGGAGLPVPAQQTATDGEEDLEFLRRHKRIVVKQARGEQGKGVFIDIRGEGEMRKAIADARSMCPEVILEQFVDGDDLRVIVMGGKIVAGAVRKPASIVGDGRHSAARLVEKQSRRRQAVTGGESAIPMDDETERCVREAGFGMEDVIPSGVEIAVRKTANLHTGGTIRMSSPKRSVTPRERRREYWISRSLAWILSRPARMRAIS